MTYANISLYAVLFSGLLYQLGGISQQIHGFRKKTWSRSEANKTRKPKRNLIVAHDSAVDIASMLIVDISCESGKIAFTLCIIT